METKQMLPLEHLLTVGELSDFLKVSVSHLRKMTHREKIPVVKIGAAARYSPNQIKMWIEQNTVQARRPVVLRRRA